jgi:hypothetical protein
LYSQVVDSELQEYMVQQQQPTNFRTPDQSRRSSGQFNNRFRERSAQVNTPLAQSVEKPNNVVKDRLNGVQCFKCKEYGHYSNTCTKPKVENNTASNGKPWLNARTVTNEPSNVTVSNLTGIGSSVSKSAVIPSKTLNQTYTKKIYVEPKPRTTIEGMCKLNGKLRVRFGLDTGAPRSIMSEKTWLECKKENQSLQPLDTLVVTFDKQSAKALGIAKIYFSCNDFNGYVEFIVIRNMHDELLLGLDVMERWPELKAALDLMDKTVAEIKISRVPTKRMKTQTGSTVGYTY